MTKHDGDPRTLVHTPAELAGEYLRFAEQIHADPGIPFGIPGTENVVIPLRAGNLVVIMGRPGHGKTSIMAYIAKAESDRIIARNAAAREAVVYVTWEQAAEELEAFFQSGSLYSVSDLAWGRVDLDIIRRQAVKRANVPIWVIGHGIGRAGQSVPRMFPETIMAALESMQEDFGVKPTLVIFDYMQLIPIREARERVEQVTEAPVRIKELVNRLGTVALVGVQARQEVDDRHDKLPGMRDGQWASSITQTADKAFSLWRPALTEEKGTIIKLEGGKSYTVTENLLLVRMLKQRFEQGRHTWALHFSPEYLKLAELETRDLNAYE
uniref:Putative helicase n=1 Tax=viral metagenome TaxID=1070528 RepID=A0A6M3J553_9ZZZZ